MTVFEHSTHRYVKDGTSDTRTCVLLGNKPTVKPTVLNGKEKEKEKEEPCGLGGVTPRKGVDAFLKV